MKQDTGTGEITLSLKEMRFVQTQTVNVPLPAVPSAASPVAKGNQNPAEDLSQQTSVANFLLGSCPVFGWIVGWAMTIQLVPTFNNPFVPHTDEHHRRCFLSSQLQFLSTRSVLVPVR